jgi:hypothetical protein
MKLLDVRIFCPVSLSCLFVVMSLKHPHETIRLHERECRHGSILLLHGMVKSTAKQLKEYCIHELRQLRQGSYSTAPPRSKIKYIVGNICTQKEVPAVSNRIHDAPDAPGLSFLPSRNE